MKRSFILECVPTNWQVAQGGACRYNFIGGSRCELWDWTLVPGQ